MFKLFKILNPLWLIENFFTCYWIGGDSPPAPANTTVTNTNIPDYAQPYVTNMLNAAQSQIYNASGTGFNPYVPYSTNPANYVAGFSPLQQQAQSGTANLTLPSQFGAATTATNNAMTGLANMSYNPTTGGYQSTSAPSLSNFTMNGPANVTGTTANAAQTGAAPTAQAAGLGAVPMDQAAQFQGPGNVASQNVSSSNVSAPNLSMYQMGGINAVAAPGMQTTNMQAAQTGYNPQLSTYQMGPASQVSTQSFNQPGTAQQFMNPYLQQSLDPQLKEIQRQYDITGQQEQSGATQSHAFGGSREALMAAENQRNKNTAMNSAIGQGYNTAFNNAQQQFNAQQAANLQAQQANQQAGLTVGGQNLNAALGVQQLGTQTGMQTALANLSNAQQANVQNQAAQLQASGMNAQQAMQAALANQSMNYNVGNTNLNAALGIQQLGAGQNLQAQQLNQASGLQAQLANQQSGLQAALANQNMGYNTAAQNAQLQQQSGLANQALAGQYGLTQGQFNQAANLANQQMAGQYGLQNTANQQQANLANQQAIQQANLANQQMGFNTQNANMQSLLGVQNLGASQNMQSQLANQSAAAQAQQLAAQQQQFGANLGLQGLQAQMAGASQLANLGSSQLGAQQSILGAQAQAGALQQQQQQAIINQAIQNYATAQQYPYMQMAALNAMVRGLPMTQASTSMYQAPQNALSQLTGLGATAAALAPKAAGGGLMSVKKMSEGGRAIPLKMMNNQQLKQVEKSPAESGIARVMAHGQLGLNDYIHSNPQAASVFSQPLPQPEQQPQQPQGIPPAQQVAQADPNRVGIGAIGTGDMTKLAGGGILAFADEGEVPAPQDTNPLANIPTKADGNIDEVAFLAQAMGRDKATEAVAGHIADVKKDIATRKASLKDDTLLRFGLGMMAAPSRTGNNRGDFFSNLGDSGTKAVNYNDTQSSQLASEGSKLAEIEMNAAKADQARQLQLAQGIITSEQSRAAKEATAANTKMYQGWMEQQKANELVEKSNIQFTHAVEEEKKNLINQLKFKNLPQETIDALAWNNVISRLSPDFLKKIGSPTARPVPQKPKAAPPPPSTLENIGTVVSNWWEKHKPGSESPVVQYSPAQIKSLQPQAVEWANANINSNNPADAAQAKAILANIPHG